ncbi:MAG: VOC family protein [Sphingobacterium sp.]|jgi:predicted enzyme related to lactoylglutathione lyase|uniref:VOC family protein n=1 Tax=Sphingobacterium sp. TaxID=341027 RepID=UPI0028447E16|nr:VOC family protein [Sphingobacterium sp.]MDR3009666.1 VOC family protein [Sphingobacterium sp.]
MQERRNPGVYFEIPVSDLNRAIAFYSQLFNFTFEQEDFDDNQMAYFPFQETLSGITGALAKGEIYKPTREGVLLYFHVENVIDTIVKALALGGKELYPATFHTDLGFAVAEIEDLEGNRIGLHQKL